VLSVPSASAVGSTVGHVIAVDPDSGDNARLTYYLVTSEHRNYFRLAAGSGRLTVVGNLSALVVRTSARRLRFVVGVRDGGRPSRSATGVLTIQIDVGSGPDGNASSVGLSASHSASGVTVDGSVMAAIAAVVGCAIITLVFSLLAVTVHRRAATSSRGGFGAGATSSGSAAASRAAWSKVATTGIDSPLYSAVLTNSSVATRVAGRTGNGVASDLCCEGPDIILTLESEPVNYAVSIIVIIKTSDRNQT